MTYTAYLLDDDSRALLLKKFPPKYSDIIAHHITVKFGVSSDSNPPEPASLKVIGYADSNDGIETLVVCVNGSYNRLDGNIYHITWSLDPSKYSAKDSNVLLKKKFTLVKSIPINGTPTVI